MKRKFSMFLAAAFVVAVGLANGQAGETKTIAAAGVASYNELVTDVGFVGKLIDKPDLANVMEGFVAIGTQGKGLAGLDKTRPCGVVVQASDADQVSGYVFLPVTDFKAVLDVVSLYSTVESQGGLYKLTPKDGKKISYAKSEGKWAYIAEKPEMLAHCDADPSSLLVGLQKHYLISGRVFLSELPQAMREKIVGELKKGIARDAHQRPNESQSDFEGRTKLTEKLAPHLFSAIDDLDQVVAGWGIDRAVGKTFLDVNVTAKAGTPLAQEMAASSKATTGFAGFRLPGSAASATLGGVLTATKQDSLSAFIELARSNILRDSEKKTPADKRALAKELINGAGDLLEKIVKGGRVDGAATVLISPTAATGLLAGYVSDGAALDKMLHTFYDAVEHENAGIAEFVKFNADEAQSIKFHTITIPIPAGDGEREKMALRLIGSKLEIVVGIGADNAYLAAGRDAMTTLKKAVQASAQIGTKDAVPVDVKVSTQQVTNFVAAVGKPKDRAGAAALAGELKKTPGKDHISLVARPISNGVQYHLEVEEGIVRAIGQVAAKQAQR